MSRHRHRSRSGEIDGMHHDPPTRTRRISSSDDHVHVRRRQSRRPAEHRTRDFDYHRTDEYNAHELRREEERRAQIIASDHALALELEQEMNATEEDQSDSE